MADTVVAAPQPAAHQPAEPPVAQPKKKDRTHWLYISVIVAVLLGVAVGLLWPSVGVQLKPIGDIFVNLIKMIIAPVIFCTIVLGIGSVAKAATVGKVGGLALIYFLTMSTFALGIGLVVGNLVHPGSGLKLSAYKASSSGAANSTVKFLMEIIPPAIPVLPTLFVALLVGFAVQAMGDSGKPVLRALTFMQAIIFRILIMIMWLAPLGAFGAIAAVVGAAGWKAIASMLLLMGAFYLTCIIFIVVILGSILAAVTKLNIFKLMRYLAKEYLLIFSTSSSETALPRLMAKMEHAGASPAVVGVTVPTGYSFNLDGTAIYLTMAALFVSNAMNIHLNIAEQLGLLLFMIIASKGAAGVTGAGLATLAAGLSSHRPELLNGMGVIVGIDKFMSEARALTNFTGNAVATLLIGRWVGELDHDRARAVLNGELPFDETTMMSDHGINTGRHPTASEQSLEGHDASSLNVIAAGEYDVARAERRAQHQPVAGATSAESLHE